MDASCRRRLLITVGAAGHARVDRPVEVEVDLDALGGADAGTLLVAEVDEDGKVIDSAIPLQFDPDPDRAPAGGTATFLLRGLTPAEAVRRYEVRAGDGCAPFPTSLSVSDVPDYRGQDSLRVETERAVYYYHEAGGGFASMVDGDGLDWLSYRPGGGSSGEYRGIPNAIHPEGGFHPGSDRCISRLVSEGPLRVGIRSESLDGEWACLWDIYPQYARLTMLKAGHPYWVLYEGTPAGKLDERHQYWVRSDGERGPASLAWEHPLPGFAWVYFGDSRGPERVVYLARHEPDGHMDSYWPMQSAMTVFGFGRDNTDRERWSNLTRVPARFTVGFAETTNAGEVEAAILSATQELSVSVSALEE